MEYGFVDFGHEDVEVGPFVGLQSGEDLAAVDEDFKGADLREVDDLAGTVAVEVCIGGGVGRPLQQSLRMLLLPHENIELGEFALQLFVLLHKSEF